LQRHASHGKIPPFARTPVVTTHPTRHRNPRCNETPQLADFFLISLLSRAFLLKLRFLRSFLFHLFLFLIKPSLLPSSTPKSLFPHFAKVTPLQPTKPRHPPQSCRHQDKDKTQKSKAKQQNGEKQKWHPQSVLLCSRSPIQKTSRNSWRTTVRFLLLLSRYLSILLPCLFNSPLQFPTPL